MGMDKWYQWELIPIHLTIHLIYLILLLFIFSAIAENCVIFVTNRIHFYSQHEAFSVMISLLPERKDLAVNEKLSELLIFDNSKMHPVAQTIMYNSV